MHTDDPSLRLVAAQLRALVIKRLARGERASAIARDLRLLGMRRGSAQRFVAYVARRSGRPVERSLVGSLAQESAMFLGFGAAGLVTSIVAANALSMLTGGVGDFAGLGGLSIDESRFVANLAGAIVGIVVASAAHALHSIPGVVGALIGATLGAYLLFTGYFG